MDIKNRDLRRLWLTTNGLATDPTESIDVMQMIQKIGFVQLDTIRNVTRAHHHILWSRNSSYRENMLWPLLSQRMLFEHFTHDASLIPMGIYPMWQLQFRRLGKKTAQESWYQSGLSKEEIKKIRRKIETEGPLSTHAFDTRAKSKQMWARPAHKKALEQMWYAGDLATAYRENFVKFYDLGERVFPTLTQPELSEQEQIDYLCHFAANQLCVATQGELQQFWNTASSKEVKAWLDNDHLIPVRIQNADGSIQKSWAVPDISERLQKTPKLSKRIRIINPFDPAVRNRVRLKRLFGFEYINEMFITASKRRMGYYVYPLLEADRFVGRVELKANRKEGWMRVTGFWPEPSVSWSRIRLERLKAELRRFARLSSLTKLEWNILDSK